MEDGILSLIRKIRDFATTSHDVRAQTVHLRAQTALRESQHDLLMRAEWDRLLNSTKNPLNRSGAKFFSQSDEDGITLEILRRLEVKIGTFAELGVGNGLESNTLILLASGWRGFWLGGEDVAFDHTINPQRLAFFKDWITLDNLSSLMRRGLSCFEVDSGIDVLSLDLDGNDYYFARKMLADGIRPKTWHDAAPENLRDRGPLQDKLFILEYNAKFPPPIEWIMPYDARHEWGRNDYFGASLASYARLLDEFSYSLVCCNAVTGANAFFVENKFLSRFEDVPRDLAELFVEGRYLLIYCRAGHPVSPKTVEAILHRCN